MKRFGDFLLSFTISDCRDIAILDESTNRLFMLHSIHLYPDSPKQIHYFDHIELLRDIPKQTCFHSSVPFDMVLDVTVYPFSP